MNKVLSLLALFAPLCALAQTQHYFQQQVDHTISVQLDDENNELNAEITTKYTNNSPDELSEIWMHLWPNAYSSGKTALAKQQYRSGDLFMFYAFAKDLGGIDDLDFLINGQQVFWEYDPENPDIAVIKLNSPLKPGESLEIYTPFKVRIPSGEISRLGHIDQSYQITQWYPKPAVYDRDGWHAMPYLDQGEFYSEYGTFDVYLTLPDNYTVGATGDMPEGHVDNDSERARLDVLDRNTRDYFKLIEGKEELPESDLTFPTSSENTKTLHFHQEDVHDFAWFADKRYKVLKDSVELPHGGRAVTTWAMFTPNEEHLWEKSSDYLNKSTYYYSLWNGDYPYNQVTAVDGTISAGGGMEYPNVTVIGESGSDFALNVVIAHEVGHNWFYGILGSNERINAWMDEGLNSFNETRYLMEYYEGKDLGLIADRVPLKLIEKLDLEDFDYRWIDELSYLFPARLGVDQPLQCHSDTFSSLNYGAIVYKKTAAVFGLMRRYLGDERFDSAMQTYFQDWKFKHPQPSDLQESMEKSCGEDLSWFFEGWIKTKEQNNWAVCNAKSSEEATTVTLKNIGGQTSPAEVALYNDTTLVATTWVKPSAPGTKTSVDFQIKESTHVIIDPERYDLDYDRTNNYSKTSGLLKKVEPLQIRMGTRLEDGNKTQIFWMPTSAWNLYNGYMLGITAHNIAIPMRNLEWHCSPLLSFKDGVDIAGISAVSYSAVKWSARARASRFKSMDSSFPIWGSIVEAKPTHRISFNLNRKFNKVVNSPWKSNLEYEYVLRAGFMTDIDDIGFFENPIRQSHKLRFAASNASQLFVGIHQRLGLELRYFSFDDLDNVLPEPPAMFSNQNLVAMANYSISHSLNKDRDVITLSLLGAYIHNLDQWSHFELPTNGFNSRFDPMADILLLGREGGEFFDAQAPNLYGALPVMHYASEWFVSARVDMDVRENIDVFVGYLTSEELNDAVAGLTYQLGPVRVQIPLYSDQILDDDNYEPYKYWTFSLNLMDLNPSKIIRKSL